MLHSTQMYIPLKPPFSRHKGVGVQFTDEPTGNLDSKTSAEVLGLIKRTSAESVSYTHLSKKGGAFQYATLRYQMLKYCEKNKIADGEYIFRSHDYRHNLATLYYDNGISLQAVRDYLGHEYEEMTRQYVDYMPKKLEKASEAYFQEETHSFAAELMKGEFHG